MIIKQWHLSNFVEHPYGCVVISVNVSNWLNISSSIFVDCNNILNCIFVIHFLSFKFLCCYIAHPSVFSDPIEAR